MKETKNYKLKKPEDTDFYDVKDFNDNTEKVDTILGELKSALDKKPDAPEGGFATKTELSEHIKDAEKHVTQEERAEWNNKQKALTFDTAPTKNSTNPVTSGGVKTAVDAVATSLNTHTSDTTKHITAAERTAWTGKQDKLTFDTAPKSGSANPVTSDGINAAIYKAVNTKADLVDGKVPSSQLPEMDYASKDLSNISGIRGQILDLLQSKNVNRWTKTYKTIGEIKTVAVSGAILSKEVGDLVLTTSDNVQVSNGKLVQVTNVSTCSVNTSKETFSAIEEKIKGKYISKSSGNSLIYKIDNSVSVYWYASSYGLVISSGANIVAFEPKIEELTSEDKNAYPANSETQDYTIEFNGNDLNGCRIATGAYTGTGVCGADNPNTLSFAFAPVSMIVLCDDGKYNSKMIYIKGCSYMWSHSLYNTSTTPFNARNAVSSENNNKTIKWYCDNWNADSDLVYGQFNRKDVTYRYFAIG